MHQVTRVNPQHQEQYIATSFTWQAARAEARRSPLAGAAYAEAYRLFVRGEESLAWRLLETI